MRRPGSRPPTYAVTVQTIAAVLAGCTASPPASPPEWTGSGPIRWRPLSVRGLEAPGFTALDPERTGIAFVNDPTEEMLTLNQHLANGAGVAMGDVDGDGRVDVLLTHTRGENVLYRNRGDFRFEEIGAEAGMRLPDRHPTGVVLADVDGDADLDALISSMGAPVALLANDGQGRFTDRSRAAGFSRVRAGSTMTLADVDGDGDLDLYAANYRLRRAADAFSLEERSRTPILEERDGTWVVNEKYRDFYRVVAGPEGVMSWEFGEADDLYLNDGAGRFERVPVLGPRFRDAGGRPLEAEPREWGLAARFRDVNGDGAPDLYVTNDFESPDQLWINDGGGSFRLLGAPALRKTSQASMSVTFADVDGNRTTDIFVADMLPVSSRLRKTQISTLEERRPPRGERSTVMQVNRNTLQLRVPGGGWVEAARQAGVAASGWSWGSEFLDVDLDGWPDLIVANGHRWDPLDADTGDRLLGTPAGRGTDWRDVINLFPELKLPNRAFHNRGDGTFDLVDGGWGLDAGPDISHGLAAGDLDGDGDLDVVVNRLGDPALVLRNDADAPRLAVRLVGRPPNTRAVGALIRVVGGPRPQAREVGAGGLYLSHSDGRQSFATGAAERLSIEVTWPGGGRTTVPAARPGRLYELRETGEEPRGRGADEEEPGTPLFEDVSSRLDHIHRDRPFEARARQPLLPRNLSRLGPGVAWTDPDDDGFPDLVVGGGAGGSVVTFRNTEGRLARGRSSPPLAYDATAILPEPGGDAVLVGVANYETSSPDVARTVAPAWKVRLVGPGAGTLQPVLASDGASTGPLATADVDGDGDLDVFMGGRVYQGAYPIVPTSRVFLRDSRGELAYDPAVSAPVARAGLVSGALFTDVDADGDPDLVLATDWGPPRLYLNRDGRFADGTREWGLAPYSGWWNGVAAGDLDGDGRMDLVLTSWGRNTRLRPRPGRPLLAYWGDFDRSGSLDVVLGMLDPRIGQVAPVSGLPRLARGLPYVRRRTTPTFHAYAEASVDQVLGLAVKRARIRRISTLDHTAFFNRGGRFEARPLPGAAQIAPAHGVSIADVDGDGAEDVLLAQNFFPDPLGAERHDAGRGLLLLGDGAGRLRPLTPAESGIVLSGDQRGLAVADFDGDHRLDVAVGQNSGATVLLRNVRAAPGLRVRLRGGAGNPHGVGATLRVVYGDHRGPAREVRVGSGFWSAHDPVQILGLSGEPEALEVRWPGGELERVTLPPGTLDVEVSRGR